MSIELDFIKRYGPPKYRINHKLQFQDEELYVVQETPPSDQELLNERLSRHTFSRSTKLYPRQGPWAEPIRYKITNNYPAFRQKSGKEVRSITDRVHKPTHSHAQRYKGDFDPDVPCPPHEKRMSYSATYWQKRGHSTIPPERAARRPYTSCSRASKYKPKSRNEQKPRPRSCPPPSKSGTKPKEAKIKTNKPSEDNSARRSLFNFLNDDFSEDLNNSDKESNKSADESVRRAISCHGTESNTGSDTCDQGIDDTKYESEDDNKEENSEEDESNEDHSQEVDNNFVGHEYVQRSERNTYHKGDDSGTEQLSDSSDEQKTPRDYLVDQETLSTRNGSSMRSTSSRSPLSSRSSSGSSRSRDSSLDSVISKNEKLSETGQMSLDNTPKSGQSSVRSEQNNRVNDKDIHSETSDHSSETKKTYLDSQASLRCQTTSQGSIFKNGNAGSRSVSEANGSRFNVRSNASGRRQSARESNLGSSTSLKSRNSSYMVSNHGSRSSIRSDNVLSVKSQHSQESQMSKQTGGSQTSIKSKTSIKSTSKDTSMKWSDGVSQGSRRSSKKESGSETSLTGSPFKASILPADIARHKSRSSLKSTSIKGSNRKDNDDNKSIKSYTSAKSIQSNKSYKFEGSDSDGNSCVKSFSSETSRESVKFENVARRDSNVSVTSSKQEQMQNTSVDNDTKSDSSSESDNSSVVSVIEREVSKTKDVISQDDSYSDYGCSKQIDDTKDEVETQDYFTEAETCVADASRDLTKTNGAGQDDIAYTNEDKNDRFPEENEDDSEHNKKQTDDSYTCPDEENNKQEEI